ncbi:chaperone protein dnaJ 11, chloroplastic-like [Syzygium oleosum]|uniref:chaperone protein dnaJ 11, chloroplastic-like n=1 Tax=Syzygium oleosum TaxID=219896 RepID=UPI0024B9BD8A|nr:chaperone protein dnaJ 11, chloroplastic-like [Syzygium oleosum]
MSLTLTPPPPPPSFASPPPRRPVAGAAAYPAAAAAAARTPTSRHRVSCRATCRAPPSPSIAELEPLPRRGEGPSLYEILRVRENASAREIKAAYRALAKAHHPDAAGRDGRDFIEIHGAYETLSDPAARAVYDLSLGGGAAASGIGRGRRPRGVGGFCPTRRWETDQCW